MEKKKTPVNSKDIEVRCYSGYTYAERPVSFTWRGKEYEIQKIESQWFEEGKRFFSIITDANKSFQLCYNETNQRWSLTRPMGG